VEGSEEHFDENESVDGLAEEERSTDGEDGSGEEVRERAGVSARENAEVDVRGERTLVWRRTSEGDRVRKRARKCAVRAHWCEGEGVKGALGCAQGTRGGGRVGIAMEWQGGERLSEEKTCVGWPEEPHLRGVLVVGFRRSANTHGNADHPSVLGVE
jgi:hypothetical protein